MTFFARGLFAALLLSSSPALAASWGSATGQGIVEASVTGEGGSFLDFYCAAGSEVPLAGFFIQVVAPGATATPGQILDVAFAIDGKVTILKMPVAEDAGIDFVGADAERFAALEQLRVELARGKNLTVAATALGWQENFPLDGSGKALQGLFAGCEK